MDTSDIPPTSNRDDIDALNRQDARIAILEEKLRLATVKAFAPKSEKLTSLAQIDLFSEAETSGAKPDDSALASEIAVPAHTRERGKRRPIDPSLPRVRIAHDIPDA